MIRYMAKHWLGWTVDGSMVSFSRLNFGFAGVAGGVGHHVLVAPDLVVIAVVRSLS